MEIARTHRHTSPFLQKRIVFFAFVVIALLSLTITAFTGSVPAGIAGVAAMAAALVTGVSVACHRGCTPR
jgi:hypothetical protein